MSFKKSIRNGSLLLLAQKRATRTRRNSSPFKCIIVRKWKVVYNYGKYIKGNTNDE